MSAFEPGPPSIVRCTECGLLITIPEHSQSEQDAFYRDVYIDSNSRAEHDFGEMRRASLQREARTIRALRPDGGRLLDVGCASGEFLRQFMAHPRWRVSGLEPSEFAARHARERHGLQVEVGTLATTELTEAGYDVVTMLDVASLFRDPESDFRAARKALAPGGLLAVEIPCLRFRLLKNRGPLCRIIYGVPCRLNQRLHLYFYSRTTLDTMLVRLGFQRILAHAEQSPLHGPRPVQWLNLAYFRATQGLYAMTRGRVALAPKEFLVYTRLP